VSSNTLPRNFDFSILPPKIFSFPQNFNLFDQRGTQFNNNNIFLLSPPQNNFRFVRTKRMLRGFEQILTSYFAKLKRLQQIREEPLISCLEESCAWTASNWSKLFDKCISKQFGQLSLDALNTLTDNFYNYLFSNPCSVHQEQRHCCYICHKELVKKAYKVGIRLQNMD